MAAQFPQHNNAGLIRQYTAHQQTMPYQVTTFPPEPQISIPDTRSSQSLFDIAEQITSPVPTVQKRPIVRIVAIALVGILTVSMYFIWRSSSTQTMPAVNTNTQHFSVAAAPTTPQAGRTLSSVTTSGTIQVYIVGAVKHPGVYVLISNARVYQLLQKAGGPLSQANLVTLNLAAPLADGQEIYVAQIGETPPVVSISSNAPATNTTGTSKTTTNTTATSGTKININTASSSEMRTGLHISSTTAQNIINYRTQHGPFTSVDQLLQVVSQAIYKKIKDEVTLV